mgnify:CR=1 FL=1
MTSRSRFQALIDEAVARSFTGWDFTWLNDRFSVAPTSWNYRETVGERLMHATALLDMCTGGGELLASLGGLPEVVFATEGYAPNVLVARSRLEALGVQVVHFEADDDLPLPDNSFDLVINRHGAYSPLEIARVARESGAIFLTQQVGSGNGSSMNEALGTAPLDARTWCVDAAATQLESHGFTIIRCEEEFPVMAFADVGALVFLLKAVPWQLPDFEVDAFNEHLYAIHEEIEKMGTFATAAHRFFIEASYD